MTDSKHFWRYGRTAPIIYRGVVIVILALDRPVPEGKPYSYVVLPR